MITFNDFEKNKSESYILDIINNFKGSQRYRDAITARDYYNGMNTEINRRLQLFRNSKGEKEIDIFVANNQIANEYYKKIVMQENSYLLGNGPTLPDEIKDNFSRTFDQRFFEAGLSALIDGVGWIYCSLDKNNKMMLSTWGGAEFIPLFDERTGALMAGIRFWQIDINKPMYVELYEIDGKTTYISAEQKLEILEPKQNYIIKKDTIKAMDLVEITESGFGMLPIFPLYANFQKVTTLTPALKQKLDLWDIVMSDFGNNLEDSKDLYWVLTNYGGQDISEFLAEYKKYKIIQTDSEGSAEAKTIEVPWQAREVLLNALKKEIFQSAMALDTEELSGSNLTNVAIKSIMANLDLKTDDFEIQALNTLYAIMELYYSYFGGNIDELTIELKRRTIINDTEVVQLIYTMREDIDQRTALEKNPLISPEEIEEILKRSEKEKSVFDLEQESTGPMAPKKEPDQEQKEDEAAE